VHLHVLANLGRREDVADHVQDAIDARLDGGETPPLLVVDQRFDAQLEDAP
jgi:hypothetical protein